MKVVHFIGALGAGALCGRAEDGGWLWSLSRERVTCSGCALLLASSASREAPGGAPGPIPRAPGADRS